MLQIATLCRIAVELQYRPTTSESLVVLAEKHMPNANDLESLGAHDAWLDSDKKIKIMCVMQVVFPLKLLQTDHLGVRTCILCLVRLVMCSLDDLEATGFWQLPYENSSHWHLSIVHCELGLPQCLLHKHLDLFLV